MSVKHQNYSNGKTDSTFVYSVPLFVHSLLFIYIFISGLKHIPLYNTSSLTLMCYVRER